MPKVVDACTFATMRRYIRAKSGRDLHRNTCCAIPCEQSPSIFLGRVVAQQVSGNCCPYYFTLNLTYFLFLSFSVSYEMKKSKSPPFYTTVHSMVTKVLNDNGYSEVNLSKLFSSFFA